MHHIIVNPAAGKGRTVQLMLLLAELMDDSEIPYMTHITAAAMDGFNIAKSVCELKETQAVIGIGGDGTLQEIVAGMISAKECAGTQNIPLGIFAAGSGNDFAISIEGSKTAAITARKKSKKDAVYDFFEKLCERRTRFVDVITANGLAYLNVGNIGIDARIVSNAVALKPTFGRHAYLAATYRSIVQHENLRLKIRVDGKNLDGKYTLVAACNGRYYGGGMHISPSAEIDDGKITLCMVDELSRPKIMVLFPSLMAERHEKLKAVRYLNCKTATIIPEKPITLCLDGNLYPEQKEIRFKILPKALEVFV